MKPTITRRVTRQRTVILEALRRTREHPDARMVYARARRRMPELSFATVYRNLGVLRDRKDILELDCGSGRHRYDGYTGHHHHFICESCEKILDIRAQAASRVTARLARELGCVVTYYRTNYYGLCKECKGEKYGKIDQGHAD